MKSLQLLAIVLLTSAVAAQAVSRPPVGRYKDVVDTLQTFHQQYPQFTKIVSIGQNNEGTELYALRVSVTPEKSDPNKVGHIVVSTHHGNELKAPVFTLYWLRELLQRYNSWELYKGRLAQTEWVVLPVLNVTGYNAGQRHEYGRDPNRDYPGPCSSSGGGKLKSIQTLINFMGDRVFSGSLTVHGYIGTLTYPWGVDTDQTHTHDHNLFSSITAKAAQYNGYRHGTSTDLIYPVNGSYEDYAYWKYGMWSLLLELDTGNDNDIRNTSKAIHAYFDQLDASPSTKNEFTGNCTRSGVLDLGIE